MDPIVNLYYQPFPGRGTLWANNKIIVVPPGWNGGKYSGWNLFWYPLEEEREKINFSKEKDLKDFLTLFYDKEINLEHPKQVVDRPQDPSSLPGWSPVTSEEIDNLFITTRETGVDSPFFKKFQEYQKQNSPAARYGRTTKSKLAQKRYRNTEGAKDKVRIRKETSKELEKVLATMVAGNLDPETLSKFTSLVQGDKDDI